MTHPKDPTLLSETDAANTEVHAAEAYCSACSQSFSAETQFCPNDGARLIKLAAERDELIGRVLDERYEIRAPLGKGGMGTVYRGWQLSVDREVAIKVIHPKLAGDRSAVKRFLREARLASRLSQPNIINVYDFGQSGGVLYLVMELLRGHTLASELGHGRRINPKRVIVIAAQLCDALEAAHAQGIVHRDLKPSNIVILDDPPGRDLIKVLDFGLAKSLVQDSGSVVTNTDALLGTPLYMAPEQIDGRASDQRSDLYSLGCILYEALAGHPPFVDSGVSAVLARHMHDTHTALPDYIPAKLRALIDGLLVKKPEQRIQTAGEVHRVLDELRDAPGFGGPTPVSIAIPDTPDTIPDVSPALAETHEAMPTAPVPMIVSTTPQLPPAKAGGAKPQRYAIVAFFAVIPIAVIALVMFNASGDGAKESSGGGPAEQGSADNAVQPVAAPPEPTVDPAPLPALVDAGVPAVMPAAPDAGVKQIKKPDRPRPPTRAKPDAGVTDPDLPFYPTK